MIAGQSVMVDLTADFVENAVHKKYAQKRIIKALTITTTLMMMNMNV